MKASKFLTIALVLMSLLPLSLMPGAAQGPALIPQIQTPTGTQDMLGSAFSYQGYLASDGTPVDDRCDFEFRLYDALSRGNLVAGPLAKGNVSVITGYFTVQLDFGDVFDGTALWLAISLKCTGELDYTSLSPRQGLTATPYALSLRPGAVISGTVGTVLTARNQNGSGIAIAGTQPGYQYYDVSSFLEPGGFFGGKNGVIAYSKEPNGYGVVGSSSASTGTGHGVHGVSMATNGVGVYGHASATSSAAYGLYGLSDSSSGRGVYGYANAPSGYTYGVYGRNNSGSGGGVYGYASATGATTYGVLGRSDSTEGRGVYGYASATSGTSYGVYGESSSPEGRGVHGHASSTSGTPFGVTGQNDAGNGAGVFGYSTKTSGSADGVVGATSAPEGTGVTGIANATYGFNYGVFGSAKSNNGYGVLGINSGGGFALYASGNAHVSGTLSKSAGSFMIDHPLDPANKYLQHSFVESPDMLNIYNGNVSLDEDGTAWVELPEWFEALNGGTAHSSEFRYQLTCIGGFAPVYIAHKIEHNRFQIAGGTPGLEVSWQVTGIRHDPYAEAHRIPVEEDKPADELGTYRHPELYGQPEELGVDYHLLSPQEIGGE